MAKNPLTFLGFGTRKPAAEGDPPEDEDKNKPSGEGDPPAEDEDKNKPSGEGDPPAEDDEDDEETTASARQARARERSRVAAIVAAGGAGKVEAALALALNSDMPRSRAIAVLDSLPASARADGGSPLARAMAGRTPPIAPSGAGDGGRKRGLKDSMAAHLERRGLKGRS